MFIKTNKSERLYTYMTQKIDFVLLDYYCALVKDPGRQMPYGIFEQGSVLFLLTSVLIVLPRCLPFFSLLYSFCLFTTCRFLLRCLFTSSKSVLYLFFPIRKPILYIVQICKDNFCSFRPIIEFPYDLLAILFAANATNEIDH